MEPLVHQNGSSPAAVEEKEAKEYGRMVIFVIKHKTAFGAIGALILAAYTTIQTLKAELYQVKIDVTNISTKVDKFDEKLDRAIRRVERK